MMDEVLEIVDRTLNRQDLREFMVNEKGYHFMGTRSVRGMKMDPYNRETLIEGAIGYTVYFQGEDSPLVFIDVTVNPLHSAAGQAAEHLAKNAFDSVPGGAENSTLYFLGIYALDNKRVLKIMLLEERTSGRVSDINLRYGLSRK